MKNRKIVPCVCIDHYPTSADMCEYGMPDIAVGQGGYISCYCRNCGRGDRFLEHKTLASAFKDWNKVQKQCWNFELMILDEKDIPDWKKKVYQEYCQDGSEEKIALPYIDVVE